MNPNLRLSRVFSIDRGDVQNGPDLFIICDILVLRVFATTFLFLIIPYNFDWFSFELDPNKLKITPTHHLSIVIGGP